MPNASEFRDIDEEIDVEIDVEIASQN